MRSGDAPVEVLPEGDEPLESTGRKKRTREWRRLMRIAYRDPEHVGERLTLFASNHLADASLEWANRVRKERPDTPPEVIAEEVRLQTAQVSRIDGAVSGTPFLIALVPGYLAYLWQEGHMERRMAALYGHNPRELETSAQILVLRGVHPTIEAARAALVKVRNTELPEKPTKRRPLRVWVRSVWTLLIFGGFVTASSDDQRDKYAHWRLKATLGFIGATLIWVITWVLPVSFMIAMAWACESHARSLGRRTMRFYSGESTDIDAAIAAADEGNDEGRTKRDLMRAGLLALSVAIPVAFIAYADHVRQTTGVNWVGALGAVVGVSLVLAISIRASRG